MKKPLNEVHFKVLFDDITIDDIKQALNDYFSNIEIEELKHDKILDNQSSHSLQDCLKELKFNRPAEAQKLIDKWIAEL